MPPIEDLMNVPDNTNEYGEIIDMPDDSGDDIVDIDDVGNEEETAPEGYKPSAIDDEDEYEEETVEEDETPEEVEEDVVEEDDTVQTPEENAFYAEQRRQRQEAERQAELDRQFQERQQQSPEFQIAQALAAQYGMPVEQMLQQLQESQLEQQAQTQGVPVEFLKQQQEAQNQVKSLEEKVRQMEFDSWMAKQEAEAVKIKADYPFLTDQDINEARHFMLNDLQTTSMPLSQAVVAKHQDKIMSHLKEQAKQEALAEISGRKSNGLTPNVSQSSPESQLTQEERHMAKMLGVSEADYLKYK